MWIMPVRLFTAWNKNPISKENAMNFPIGTE